MIETLIASTLIVGSVITGPNQITIDYLTDKQEVITIVETIQEIPN